MARYTLLFLLAIAIIAFAFLVAGQLGMLRGKAPADLGLKDGKLKHPSKTENSVSSQAALWPDHPRLAYAQIEPLKYTGSGADAMKKLATVLAAMPRTSIVSSDANYIYAQCETALVKYTDDIEFALDEAASAIHVRSASRLGQKDFGVNRARVESIRASMAK
jgi:uncharacterized protein (DUF1499 family)